jgi:phosphoribosylformimino-5-aminoimidazole carboxamide ribotide isomerase
MRRAAGSMILLAAIDILEGRAVRLARGEFDQRTVYDADPLEAARRWAVQGARALHVVDLDGARAGEPVNLEHVRSICAEVQVPVQVGGGLRSIEALEAAFAAGAWRAVLGTAAYRDLDLLDEALARFGDRIVVSIDARGGRLAASAWSEQTEVDVQAAIEHLGARGVRRFVYSSIERDGMLAGPDLDGVARAAGAVRGSFVYSGGIGTLEDLRALAALRQVNLAGVIVGRALYERRFDIAAAQRALDGGR